MTQLARCLMVVMITAVAGSGCAGVIRPYDPLTDRPTTLLTGERLDAPAAPVEDGQVDPRDAQLDALERRMGIAPRK